jgi:uncharacterized protein YceH (UPF0502 family)
VIAVLAWLKTLNPRVWLFVGLFVLFAAYTIGVFRAGGSGPRAELAAFKAEVAAAGKAQQAQNERDARAREAVIQQREAEHATTVANLTARYDALAGELRKPDPGRRTVPTLAAAAPQLTCPDRAADFARRMDELETEVARLIARGDQALADLALCVSSWPN